MTRIDLARHFASLGFQRGAEIGVRQGVFSEILLQEIPGLRLLCIDPWLCYPTNPRQRNQATQDRFYRDACARLAPYTGAVIVRKPSIDAALDVPPGALDFVYIDGNHNEKYVRADVAAWEPLVRSGGVVSGDDYDAPGVRAALKGRVVQLAEEPRRHNIRAAFKSWWWVKP